jgi:CheY-like chemotaxis protein
MRTGTHLSDQEAAEKIQTAHLRRLQFLEERVAKQGINTPPDVLMELEDIRAALARNVPPEREIVMIAKRLVTTLGELDNAIHDHFLGDLLTRAGYETHIARHGGAAFADLEITQPDVMLVDVFMPTIDGVTFCRMARANHSTRDTPIIVMSAMPDAGRDFPVPISGFLTKPLDIDALLHLVASLLAEPGRERHLG